MIIIKLCLLCCSYISKLTWYMELRFMPADVLWSFAMSLNVYFTFYWHYNATDLKELEIYYIMVCYGLPFIPALTFLFVSSPEHGHVYGDATLWCWIAPGWDIFRIVTFYGVVW